MRIFLLLLFACIRLAAFSQTGLYKETWRPQFHFTPAKNWCNDPNGLMYYKGVYHLFYQHNPFGNSWGHMSWGHATSKDLLYWEHQPLAIPEENGIMIFSGTCVADENNTSGFAKENGQVPFVAIYTGHIEGVNQSQHIAYSLDEGKTWTKYAGNPVLDLQKKDFRDPKVFWYAPKKYWVMAVMLPVEHKVQFYSSPNLKSWSLLSEFGPAGDTSGVWECPDLVEVPAETEKGKKTGGKKTKWLLQMSMNAGMQYFVGEFDGVKFINENPADKIYRPDYGPDYYAAISFGQLPKRHPPVAMGWINNWNYANAIPTLPWKGAMTLPRTLRVKKVNNEWILMQRPYTSILKQLTLIEKDFKTSVQGVRTFSQTSQQLRLNLHLGVYKNKKAGVRIASDSDQYLEVGYDDSLKVLYADRSRLPDARFHAAFTTLNRFEIPYTFSDGLYLEIFLDHSIAEIFVNKGERVFTLQLFPELKHKKLSYFNTAVNAAVPACEFYSVRSIW